MNIQTIRQLNRLNQDFYMRTAHAFDSTRQQPWEGWTQLIPFLHPYFAKNVGKEKPTVLDVGCGNGRFAEFLHTHFPDQPFTYEGIDSSTELLDRAKEKLAAFTNISSHFLQMDLTEDLSSLTSFITSSQQTAQQTLRPMIIVLFGVLHHIPSHQLRKNLLSKLAELLAPGGLLIFTAWQFQTLPNLLERQVSPGTLMPPINLQDLESNDYFLTWERETSAIRYCHLITEEEGRGLMMNTPTDIPLEVLTTFSADGKNHTTNLYFLFSKKADHLGLSS